VATAPDMEPVIKWLMTPDAAHHELSAFEGLLGRPAWMKRGACRGLEPSAFVASRGNSVGKVRDAKAICGQCPVRAECSAYALADSDICGVWGGTTARERRQLRATATRVA
jgi:WhiB family transcriptional regulator, redox-sensing transcriptional regulator